MNEKQLKEFFPESFESLKQLLSRSESLEEEQKSTQQEGDGENSLQDGQSTWRNQSGKQKPFRTTQNRTSRQGSIVRVKRSNRSIDRLGQRRSNTKGRRLGTKSNNKPISQLPHIKFRNNLKEMREEYIGVTRRSGYMKPLEMLQPTVSNTTDDSVIVQGSEFLQFVQVITSGTSHSNPSQPGDILAFVPLNPQLLSGTRLAQMSSLYQKYKFLDITFEFVPSVPSLQDGSLIMLCVYDPTENYSNTTTDPVELMRFALSHQGANLFNVYDYGRSILFDQPDSLQSYFIKEGNSSRQEMQACFLIVAGSSFTNSTSPLTLGSIVMHYHCKLLVRDIIDPVDTTLSVVDLGISTTNTLTWNEITVDSPVAIKQAVILLTPDLGRIYVLRVTQSITGDNPLCYDQDVDVYPLFSRGSIWFGRFQYDTSTQPLYIYSNFERALDLTTSSEPVRWSQALTGATAITCRFDIFGYQLSRA